MRILKPFLVMTIALQLWGCIADQPLASAFADDGAYRPYSSFSNFTNDPILLVRGHLTGDIGPMRNMDNAAQLNGYHDDGFTAVEVITTSPQGAAMALLDIHGGINHPSLVPGTQWVFRRNEVPNEEGALFVTGLGCAGDGAVGDWDFDRPLDEVRIVVEHTENPNVKRLSFTTVTRDDEAHGYVDVAMMPD